MFLVYSGVEFGPRNPALPCLPNNCLVVYFVNQRTKLTSTLKLIPIITVVINVFLELHLLTEIFH